jgi:hypothetical protein
METQQKQKYEAFQSNFRTIEQKFMEMRKQIKNQQQLYNEWGQRQQSTRMATGATDARQST